MSANIETMPPVRAIRNSFEISLKPNSGVDRDTRHLRVDIYLDQAKMYSARVFEYISIEVKLTENSDVADESVLVDRSWLWLSSLYGLNFPSTDDAAATDAVIVDINSAFHGKIHGRP